MTIILTVYGEMTMNILENMVGGVTRTARKFYIACLVSLCCIMSADAGSMTVVEDGRPSAVISLPSEASPAEQTAARELRDFIEQMTGVRLVIAEEGKENTDGKKIYIGQSGLIGKKLGGVDFSKLRPDEIILQSVEDGVVLSGARPRGTLYAVYTLLEDYFGVRFWSSTETEVPRHNRLTVPALSTRYAPPFAVREATGFDLGNPLFAARRRNNGHWQQIPEQYGGHESLLGWCHTFSQLLPPDQYFQKHPEWYSEIHGKRVRHGQLCLSNPEVAKALAVQAAKWLRENPAARMISISQNDGFGFCECKECRRFLKNEDGRQSAILLKCINQVAEYLEKEYPEVIVETLAYRDTRRPPLRIRPGKNVMIRLCSIEADFGRALDSAANMQFKRDVEDWGAITGRLMIWNYIADYSNYLIPYPNLANWANDLRFLARNHAWAVFQQGDDGSSGRGDFNQLRSWVISQLMWNPERKVETLLEEFCLGYYGRAAGEFIVQYWNSMLETVKKKPEARIHCYLENTDWLAWADLITLRKLMARALDATQRKPPYYERVKRAALSADVALLLRPESLNPKRRKEAGLTLKQLQDLARITLDVLEKNGVRVYGEHLPLRSFTAKLRQLYELDAVPELTAEARAVAGKAAKKSWLVPAKNTTLLEEGNLTFRESDPKALNGETIRLITPHESWRLIQFPLSGLRIAESPQTSWRILAHLRSIAQIPGKADARPAVRLGVWCSLTDRTEEVTLHANEISEDKYTYYEIGKKQFKLHMNDFLFLLPLENHSLKGILCDHVLLIPNL